MVQIDELEYINMLLTLESIFSKIKCIATMRIKELEIQGDIP